MAAGVPGNKLVIGKPATSGDANNGYIAPETLAECLQTAKAAGWSAGAMSWQVSWHDFLFFDSVVDGCANVIPCSTRTLLLIGSRLCARFHGRFRYYFPVG